MIITTLASKHTGLPPRHTAEASDIGMAAGVWPTSFDFNGTKFFRVQPRYIGDGRYEPQELASYIYVAENGAIMEVFND